MQSPDVESHKCQCPNCDSETAHKPNRCRRKPRWYLEVHAVDICKDVPDRCANVCQACFDAHVHLAKRTIAAGMNGIRSPLCQGCYAPMTRLYSIIREVGKL